MMHNSAHAGVLSDQPNGGRNHITMRQNPYTGPDEHRTLGSFPKPYLCVAYDAVLSHMVDLALIEASTVTGTRI